ncbi:transcriptional regulator [Achromobacter mucicolens]|uniref:transcriptional regulator n=1 Tax=Achromobacter mucicolens TaxID=1389922 RepID=UPI0015D11A7F|nr:YdaS family helix-turn-helix protein [Achromobacter mucicolens]
MTLAQFKHRQALTVAIGLAGSKAALARMIDVLPQQIGNWLTRDKEIDPVYCARIETCLEGRVTRPQLRPDDWQIVWPELATAAKESVSA